MTAQDVQAFENIAIVIIVNLGVLAGLEIGRAFSFWKW